MANKSQVTRLLIPEDQDPLDHIFGQTVYRVPESRLTPDLIAKYYQRCVDLVDFALLENKRDREMDAIERKKKKVREELAYLRAERIALLKSGAFTPEGYVEEVGKLESEIDSLHEEEIVSEEAMRELMKEVILLSELLKNVVPVYDFANPQEKEKITRAIFSELSFSHDTLEYKVKKGLETFDKRFSSLCGPERTRTLHVQYTFWIFYFGFASQNITKAFRVL